MLESNNDTWKNTNPVGFSVPKEEKNRITEEAHAFLSAPVYQKYTHVNYSFIKKRNDKCNQ